MFRNSHGAYIKFSNTVMRTLLLSKCFIQRRGEGGEEFENNDGDALNAVVEEFLIFKVFIT